MAEQAEQDPRELQQLAAQQMISTAVSLITTMALTAGIVYLIGHRYQAEQLARRARAWLDHKRDPDRAAKARALAEFRRDLSRYEHDQAARAPKPERTPGLYER